MLRFLVALLGVGQRWGLTEASALRFAAVFFGPDLPAGAEVAAASAARVVPAVPVMLRTKWLIDLFHSSLVKDQRTLFFEYGYPFRSSGKW